MRSRCISLRTAVFTTILAGGTHLSGHESELLTCSSTQEKPLRTLHACLWQTRLAQLKSIPCILHSDKELYILPCDASQAVK